MYIYIDIINKLTLFTIILINYFCTVIIVL